jgi:3-hydroxymyristoyl/3-hydroxydecanoyl-(acyl carrier protein) dehydratase
MTLYTNLKDSLIKVSAHGENEITAEFEFSESREIFRGHFPGNPILPGIAQIEMVKLILELFLEAGLVIKTIKKTKFSHQIEPGALVHVRIKLTSGQWSQDGPFGVRADITSNAEPAGRVNLILDKHTD